MKQPRLRSLVANAGDEGQVRKAAEYEQFARDRRQNGWRYLLATPIGRELAATMLGECHVFETIMATSPFIFENAGRHDFGLTMRAEMIEADADNYFVMEKEALIRNRRTPEPEKTEKDPPDPGDPTDG